MSHEEVRARDTKMLRSKRWENESGLVPGRKLPGRRREYVWGPELKAELRELSDRVGPELAALIVQDARSAQRTDWLRTHAPHPWEKVPEVALHFDKTRAEDIHYKLMSFWRRWSRLWWKDVRPAALSALPTYAEPKTSGGKGRAWKRPPKELPPDDPTHPIGTNARLKGLFVTASFAEQEVAVGLTEAATGSVPAWMVPVSTADRQRRKPGGKALTPAERKRRQRAKEKLAK